MVNTMGIMQCTVIISYMGLIDYMYWWPYC